MPYVELHCHSAFSFLDGASHPIEIASVAAEQGHAALALTDHDGLHGAMEFATAAKALGVRPITGAELTLNDGSHVTVLCESRRGYRNLCLLLTRSHADTRTWSASGTARRVADPSVSLEDLELHAEGLVCLSGCARDGAVARHVQQADFQQAATVGRRLLDAFGSERFRIELQRPFARHDRRRNRLLAQLAERLGVPCVATGNVHAHALRRVPLQDAFVAVRLGTTLDESEPYRRGNSSHVLASPETMAERFADHPEAVHESGRLAERLEFDLKSDLGYRYPGADDETADLRLAEICSHALDRRYEGRSSRDAAKARLDRELALIRSLGLSGFFLLHRDLLELAREVAVEVRGASSARSVLPPGRGRGSSVSSIVCYLTGLSHVDPVENDLFLGRFLNEELSALPDIDLDFPRDIREVLIPRVHERYGHDRSALVAAFATYQSRSAIRDFGKALGVAPGEIERAARSAEPWGADRVGRDVSEAIGARRSGSPRWRALVELASEAHALPRHVTQHAGGMVISTEPLNEICPIQPAAMDGRQMVQWDKDSCADAGFLKIDLLGLGMLSAVERCVDQIARVSGEHIDLSRIPFDDASVYREIQAAETMGTFQIESRAQMQMLRRTLPESLDDLTVQVALVRPGPIIGGAVHPYIERRKALRADPGYEVPYEHPSLEPVLRDTLGSIVFQDQVIEVAMAFAGFTSGEAEGLRRGMSRKRSEEALRAYEQKFIDGAVARGATADTASRVYAQIVGFSGFGFPKAHSAAFALLAYQSTWLRVHHGAEFLCALLNEQPMGFYPPDTLVHEAQRRGIPVLPPNIAASEAECSVERTSDTLSVRIGLGYVAGVRSGDVRAIVAERERCEYRSVEDLASRCSAQPDALARIAWAGALDSLVEGGRREALWRLGVAAPGMAVPGGTQLALPVEAHDPPQLKSLTAWERLIADYGSTKVTLREHPLSLMRDALPEGTSTSAELEAVRSGSQVRVAGVVVARQRPATAHGVTFMLLEDEHGTTNVIVPVPVYERCRLAVRAEPLVIVAGRLERRDGVTNVVASTVGRLERPDLPLGEVRHIEPRRVWSNDEDAAGAARSRDDGVGDLPHVVAGVSAEAGNGRDGDVSDLRAVMPAAHSFGRRG
jgi:error-prone DNA polymerase